MKKLLSFSAIAISSLILFSSCEEEKTKCYVCDIIDEDTNTKTTVKACEGSEYKVEDKTLTYEQYKAQLMAMDALLEGFGSKDGMQCSEKEE